MDESHDPSISNKNPRHLLADGRLHSLFLSNLHKSIFTTFGDVYVQLFLIHWKQKKSELLILLLIFSHAGNQRSSYVAAPVTPEVQKTPPTIEVPQLSLEDLEERTDNFGTTSLIGEGSYGRVYYATLNNDKAVALKRLDVSSDSEPNNEFLTQVSNMNTRIHILDAFVFKILRRIEQKSYKLNMCLKLSPVQFLSDIILFYFVTLQKHSYCC